MRIFLISSVALLVCSSCSNQEVPFDSADPLEAQVSGEKAFEQVAALVGFGPRPAGSGALEDSRHYIENQLSAFGWQVVRQEFTEKTSIGEVEFVNLRARFGEADWEEPITGLLASHYDTKLYRSFEFVGANDGGSSSGLLIELARVLATRPEVAAKLELVFFDGEEAFGTNITSNDGLYGSRHYAGKWVTIPAEDRPKWGILLDMVGDRDLKVRAGVQIPGGNLKKLASEKSEFYTVDFGEVKALLNGLSRALTTAADDLGFRKEIGISPDYITDDHVPLNVSAGIPTIDLIDFDYPYWHTPGDTLDKISEESLEIVGRVTLLMIEKYLLPEAERWLQ